jgi:hypothetical protein
VLDLFIEQLANNLGFIYYVLVYGVGIVSMVLSTVAFQFKKRFAIVLCSSLGQTSWVIYFLLQADLVSAIACGLSAIILALFTKQAEWKWVKSPICILLCILLLSGFSIWSFAVWSDVFPILAGIFAVIANSRTSEKRLRQFSIFWCGSWLLNSLFKMYPVALINDLFCTVSTVVALVRYREKAKG